LNEVRKHVETGRGTETKGGTKIPNLAWNGFAEEKREKNGRFKRAKVSWSDHGKGIERALEAGAPGAGLGNNILVEQYIVLYCAQYIVLLSFTITIYCIIDF
jgi:hypothetical protein